MSAPTDSIQRLVDVARATAQRAATSTTSEAEVSDVRIRRKVPSNLLDDPQVKERVECAESPLAEHDFYWPDWQNQKARIIAALYPYPQALEVVLRAVRNAHELLALGVRLGWLSGVQEDENTES